MNLTGCFKAPTQLVDPRMGPAGGAVNLTKIDLSGGFCYVTQAAPGCLTQESHGFYPLVMSK